MFSLPTVRLRPFIRTLTLTAAVCGVLSVAVPTSYGAAWGVAGHDPLAWYPVYRDIPASQQLDCVNELGCTYYRGVASAEMVDLIRTNPAYAHIRLIPVLSAFGNADIETNPNGYTDAYFYSTAKTKGIDWVNSWTAGGAAFPFDCVEICNELDLRCIVSGVSGSSFSHYDTARFNRCKAIIQGLCDGVRAAHPTLPRMVGCAGWLHYGFVDRLISELGAPVWERVVYHWYSNMGLISSHSDVIAKLQGYATNYSTPIWITEVNCRDGSLPDTGETSDQAERRHAGTMADLIHDMKQFSFIHCICVYQLLDEVNQAPNEAHYGLYRVARDSGGPYYLNGEKPMVTRAYRGAVMIDSGGTYELEPGHAPGMRLNVTGGSTASGANVDIYSDTSSNSQRWKASYMGDGYFEFQPLSASSMRLDVAGGASANGTNVQQYVRTDSNAQLWWPHVLYDGTASLAPKCATGSRLDVSGSGTTNGTNVKIWTINNALNQSWLLYNYSTRRFETESLVVQASSGESHHTMADPNLSASEGSVLESNGTGDYVGYLVANVAAGSYNVKVGVKKYSSRGIVQLAVGRADAFSTSNSNVGAAQDLYASASSFVELNLGTWTPGTTGDKEFRFKVTGKNAASSGYTIGLDYIILTPQ